MNFKRTISRTNFLILNWCLTALSSASDSAATKPNAEPIDFAVGGQAVIEGVMMRSPNYVTIAVRKSDGSIKVDERHYQTVCQRYKFLNIPILRGVINLFEMMIIGTKAINFSADEAVQGEMSAEELKKLHSRRKSKGYQVLEAILFILSFVFAIALSLSLFKVLPLYLATFVENHSAYVEHNWIIFNLIDGLIKISIFIGYIGLLSLFPSFKRIFEYHGAEHKSIFNYENKLPLSVPNAKKQTRFHPRCGTSFILIVFVISIIVYTFIPKQPTFIENLAIRLVALPLIAGISYEFLKFSAKHLNSLLVRALVQPGLWFQRLTTREPDNSQLEVGLESLKAALKLENKN